jgi:hypothetical protein
MPFLISTYIGGHVTATGEVERTDAGGPGPAIMLCVIQRVAFNVR